MEGIQESKQEGINNIVFCSWIV